MYLLHFEHHELANNLVKERVKILNDNQNYNEIVTLDTVWDGIEIGLKAAVNSLETFAKEIPGLNEIVDTVDFRSIINNRLFDYLMVKCLFSSYLLYFNHIIINRLKILHY